MTLHLLDTLPLFLCGVFKVCRGEPSRFLWELPGGEVPPATLREAGTLALCHSSAWDKQIVISAWWVPLSQVTRGAELMG